MFATGRRPGVWPFLSLLFLAVLGLTVVWFPTLLRPGLSGTERARIERQGTDELLAAENDRSNAQNNIRATLLQGLAGIALLTGAYFAYGHLKATRDGQITTRYTEAVKLLGDAHGVDARIGGIYALERIARNSAPDAPAVVALLSAFVRRRPTTEAQAERSEPEPTPDLSRRAPDRQIALTVLSHLGLSARIDLFNADLRASDLRDLQLNEANLYEADLRAANASGADLTRAILKNSKLHGADLRGAKLSGAILYGADLRTNLDTNFPTNSLTGANLQKSDLRGAYFRGAELAGANLCGADLSPNLDTKFPTNLTGANVTGANLTAANLTAANFQGANLTGANLQDADLTGAVGVDLSNTTGTPRVLQDGSSGAPAED